MDELVSLAAKAAAAFFIEAAARTAGPVTEWLRQRLGTKKAKQLAANVDDAYLETKVERIIQQELEAHPALESELERILNLVTVTTATYAEQTVTAGNSSTNIVIQGDNTTVEH